MKTKSFDYIDEDGALYMFTVMEDFFIKCPVPHLYSRKDLNVRFHLTSYLHSLEGPAVICPSRQMGAYWILGIKFDTMEMWEMEARRLKFENKIDLIINDE